MSHGSPDMIRAASSIRRAARKEVHNHARPLRQAVVGGLDPLWVELVDANIRLEEEDLNLGQSVRQYDLSWGLGPGDTLLVQQQPDGEFLVSEVLTQKLLNQVHNIEIEPIDEPVETGHGLMIGTIEAYDKDGVKFGVIPIYDPDTLQDSFLKYDFPPVTASGTLGDNGPTYTKKVPIYHPDGSVLGWVALYDSL